VKDNKDNSKFVIGIKDKEVQVSFMLDSGTVATVRFSAENAKVFATRVLGMAEILEEEEVIKR